MKPPHIILSIAFLMSSLINSSLAQGQFKVHPSPEGENPSHVTIPITPHAREKVSETPFRLVAEATGNKSSLTLKWTALLDDTTGFVIEMMTDGKQFAQIGAVGPDINSFAIDGLSIGVKYKFRVRKTSASINRVTNIAESEPTLFTQVSGGDLTTYEKAFAGVSWGDVDNDGDPDLFVGEFEPDAIYYNENGNFTRQFLRSTGDYSLQGQWIDYNNDGFLDLHVTVGGGNSGAIEKHNDVFYKNNGAGQLAEQTNHLLSKDGYPDFTAAWGDLKKDGYLDMVASRQNGVSNVFLNVGTNFTYQDTPSGLTIDSEGMITLADLDDDRDLDVINDGINGSLVLFENKNGQFHELTNTGLSVIAHSFLFEDFDNDGTHDFLFFDHNKRLKLFLADPVSHRFKEKTDVFPSFSSDSKLSAADFDNNGFIDLFITGQSIIAPSLSRIFLNNGNLNFTSVADPVLKNNLLGTAFADYNKDGQLDAFALDYHDASLTKRILLQGVKNEFHWLRIKLKGDVNKFGIGARVRIFSGDSSQVRDIRSGSTGKFNDEQVAHFGLGTTTTIDYIKVEWPSGQDQWIANPAIDTELVVEEETTAGPPAPASPSNLVINYHGNIDLHWTDNSNNEKFFRIERITTTNTFETLKILPANTTSYTDSTLADFADERLNVSYRIVAVSYKSVESAPSNEASLSIVLGVENERHSPEI
jgi:hypothetical protein